MSYSNSSATVVNGNTFLINANTESFSLPEGANASFAQELFVSVSGVLQDFSAYTYPSVVYGNHGIDIGDNTATKLLLNFVVFRNKQYQLMLVLRLKPLSLISHQVEEGNILRLMLM